MRLWRQLWHDQGGMIVSTELVYAVAIIFVGLLVGLVVVRVSLVKVFVGVATGMARESSQVGFDPKDTVFQDTDSELASPHDGWLGASVISHQNGVMSKTGLRGLADVPPAVSKTPATPE